MAIHNKTKVELINELHELQQANNSLKATIDTNLRLHKLTEEALLASEERFRNLFNKAPLGYQSLDFDGNFVEVNQQWLDTLGYEREEVIGKWFGDFLTPVFKDGFRKRFPIFKAQGKIHSEFEMVHKNGSVLFIAFDGRIGYDLKGEFKQTHCILQDITERKQSEQALVHFHKLMHYVIEHSQSAIAIHDKDLRYIYVSQRYLHDYKVKEKNIIGKHHYDVFPDLPQKWRDVHQKALTGVISSADNDSYPKEDGTLEWTRWECRPWYEADDSIGGIIIYTEVITERKQAEEALRKSEENLSITLRSIGDGVISTDINGLIVSMNPIAEELCGWKLTDASGKPLPEVFKIINDITRETVADPVKKVLENGEIVGLSNHTVLISRNGKEYQIADSAAPIKNKEGKIIGVVLVFSDVTGKYAAEMALKEREQRFKSLIENAPDGVVIIDEEGKFTYGSPNASRHFGYAENEIIGRSGDEFTHPEDLPLVLDALKTIMYNPVQKPKVKYRFKRKNGEFRWIETTFTNLLSEKTINGIVLNFSDITERKQMLEELVAAKDKAEESDRLKSAFLANMSHEIRTPMNGILGFAELLKKPGLSGEEQQNYIRIIEKSGARMLNTINDIIDISKIEAGLIKLDIKESNVNEQMEYIYNFFKPEVQAKGMKLYLNAAPAQKVIIQTDREKLYAILSNLVKNAIKYSEKGSIEFGYNHAETLHETPLHDHSYLQFFVKDTGIGIPKDRQDAIFERFIRADIENKKARQGSGLGLAITKSYIEMLGGKIWVESEEGIGSTFYFTLPYIAVKDIS